jgi:hypothetical protein
MHFHFNGSGEWEAWDITARIGDLTLMGDPAVTADGHPSLPAVRTTASSTTGSTIASRGLWTT